MSERSGGSFWLDAVLYDSAPPKADALLDSATYEGDPLLANTAGRDARPGGFTLTGRVGT